MAKDVISEDGLVEGGIVVLDRAEIYLDGPLDLYSPVDDRISSVSQLGEDAAEFYRALVERGYLTQDDPMYDEIKHLL